MKKNIEVSEDTLQKIMDGKRVAGSLRVDEWTGSICFRAYNRRGGARSQDRMVLRLEHGWVKESPRRVKLFESLPKGLSPLRMQEALRREVRTAEDAIFEKDLLEFIID